MKSKDEEFGRSKFNQFLKALYPIFCIHWRHVPQNKEPPHYYLRVCRCEFATEITFVMELLDLGCGPFQHLQVRQLS